MLTDRGDKKWLRAIAVIVWCWAVIGIAHADWQQKSKLTASDGTLSDYFGHSVAIDGNYAIVGAIYDDPNGNDSGSAYIFKRSDVPNDANWYQQAKLTASDGAAFDYFGISVSISGEYAVVGANQDNDNGENSGSAYIFNRVGETWTQQQKLTASEGVAWENFGRAVSINGDYLIIGAYADDGDSWDEGAAYIFNWNGTSWIQQDKLTASDHAASDYFGNSVSISGNYAIVGAYLNDASGLVDSGSAYIFTPNDVDPNNWDQQAKLTASDGAAADRFGTSVAIDGNYTVVGAYLDDDNGNDSGSAYIFNRSGTTWTQQAKLTASDGTAGDGSGYSVAISADYAIVGAWGNGGVDSGSAYTFKRTATSWQQADKLVASDGAADDRFGLSVSISGDYAIAAAPWDDDNGSESGSAYVFKKGRPTADMDGDYCVTFIDFVILGNQWLQAPGVPSADIAPPGGDGVVDSFDLDTFTAQWLICN